MEITTSIVDAIANELAFERYRAWFDSSRKYPVTPDPCPRHYAHHWILNGKYQKCKHCKEKRLIPVMTGDWRETYKPYILVGRETNVINTGSTMARV